ncbi:hypothetical protein QBC42DRAFT_313220 [Cladorrhinum samala]|uniref:Uncharacterized protein n=1 Tax=Cladorrhinum samala TaxID=585594 RepID=A0AAV9HEQ0_9PEZI|nr:hypothetical protein QBC42DRAFT_313220 [Cladorrhinum samala]
MAVTYDAGPEPTRQDYPEVAYLREPQQYQSPRFDWQLQQQQQQHPDLCQQYDQPHQVHGQQNQLWEQQQPYQQSRPLPYTHDPHSDESSNGTVHEISFLRELIGPSSTYAASSHGPHEQPAVPAAWVGAKAPGTSTKSKQGNEQVSFLAMKIWGCSLIVFVLSCLIALLSATVIGLSAVTGVESRRANENASKLASILGSVPTSTFSVTTTASLTATPTSLALIDEGCAEAPDKTNGTTYVSYSFFGSLKFTRYCNLDVEGEVIYSLFTGSFATCIDACASYTMFMPRNFGNTEKATCTGVSFVPDWVGKANAARSKAQGNCYMKAGPQNLTRLAVPNKKVDVHGAVLVIGA